MGKKKAIKLATATAIAASAFVAVAPTQSEAATSSVDKAITKATNQMAKAYDTYHKAAKNDSKLPATGTIRNQTALAKDYYDKAKAEIAVNGGSKTKQAAYTKKLDAKKYFLDRAQAYVNAINTNLNPAKTSFTKAVEVGKAKQVLAAQTVLNKNIASFEGKVAKIYGPDARNLLLKKYADPATKLADTVNDEMKVYKAYKEIENGFLIEKDVKKAGEIIESVKAEVEKLKAKNTKLAKSLLAAVEKNNAAYEKANSPVVSKITAVNATTVELTYKEEVKDVEAKDFSIEGLTVTNAVVKQTDAKTVVLTTSTQEGGKEYTVKSGEEKLGLFKGISAVIPTAINVTTPSIQGKIGKEVTVKATVTVPEGQSKAGIPVTVNIPKGNSLNEAITAEVYTNADGEASYSYTRYSEANDEVIVYATGDRSKFSTAKVYFADALTVTEVTAGNSLVNGSKKVYKVTGAANSAVNVTFKENVQVTPDKLVTGAKIEDAVIRTLNANGSLSAANGSYPYEVTTGGVQVAVVQLNEQGTATFTVTGSNATVTPIVFKDGNFNNNGTWSGNGKLGSTELQAFAPSVTFALSHTLGLNVKAEGVQNAAAISNSTTSTGTGGRDYTVTLTDKDGKIAPEGSVAYVTFKNGNVSTGKVNINNGSSTEVVKVDGIYKVTVGKEGKAKFKLTGAKDSYATPTVFLNNGTSSDISLDDSDLKAVGETTYFVNAVVNNATLVTKNAAGKEATSVAANEKASFIYQSIDQNGFDYYIENGNYEVTYQVTAQFGDVTVTDATGTTLTKVAKGTTKPVKVNASQGAAVIYAFSDVASTISVEASASQVSLPNKTASVSVAGPTPGTEISKVVSAVNASTTLAEVKAALAGYAPYEALKASSKVTVENNIFNALLDHKIYNAASLKSAVEIEVTVTAVNTAAIEAAAGDKAKGVYSNSTNPDNTLTIESAAGATEYNGMRVVFEKNNEVETKVVTSYDGKVLKVKLPVSAIDEVTGEATIDTTNATFAEVEKAIELFNGGSKLTVTLAKLTGDASELVGKTVELKGATETIVAKDGVLVLTFSEALTNTELDDFTVTGTSAITKGQSNAEVSEDKKKVTITISGTDQVRAGDTITNLGSYEVNGKTIVYPIVIK